MPGGGGKPPTSSAAFGMQRLVQLLSQAEHRVTRELARMLEEEEGFAVDQWRILLLLADGASHPMSEVAELAHFPAPTLTRLVDRMVAENLVYRKADPRDRRRVLIHISARGRSVHERLGHRIEDAILREADSEDVAQLTALLVRLVDRLR